MDPRQQPPRPPQRTPYISDFVSVPRTRQDAASPANPANTANKEDDLNQAHPTTPSAPETHGQQQASPQLIRSTPATTVVPRQSAPETFSTAKPSGDQFSSPTNSTPTSIPRPDGQPSPPKHESFALPKMPTIEPQETTTEKPHQGLRDLLSIFGVLASALLLAFCLITFVFQSYQVDGPSMQSTLQDSDHLIVWKVPKTIAKVTGNTYIPNRGDVIIFDEPGAVVGGSDKQLVKRVIALPGERVTVKEGAVTVYNDDFPNGFNPDRVLPYGEVITDTPNNVDVTVKEGQVFVMGDNRGNSLDSRAFGPIDADQIVGKLVLRILPLNAFKVF